MPKKEENAFTEALQSMSYLLRHRGPIHVPSLPGIKGRTIDTVKIGKKTFHLNNYIPALIEDTFNNLGYERKDGTKPVIAAKRKTEYGWHLVVNLPPGISFKKVKEDKHCFQDAVNGWIDLEWKHGKCHMNIQLGDLPEYIEYQFNPADYSKMFLPIPIGYSRTKLIVLDLPDSPHMLIAGATGGGKTSLINSIIHSVLHTTIVIMIDLKRVDFAYLEGHILVATTNPEALAVLTALTKEFYRRTDILRKYKVKKWSLLPEELPYIVVVVDEIAELSKECFTLLDGLVRLARATGISVIAASQRTSVQVIPGDTRSNFLARICFRVGSETDSRVVLGEDCGLAGQLPAIKGRAIYRYGLDTVEVQTMYLSDQRAELMLQDIPIRKEVINVEPEPTAKRLKPR
jgi:S-DNA-T family DNA segregation ATPase FtsK/SpoIIIE